MGLFDMFASKAANQPEAVTRGHKSVHNHKSKHHYSMEEFYEN